MFDDPRWGDDPRSRDDDRRDRGEWHDHSGGGHDHDHRSDEHTYQWRGRDDRDRDRDDDEGGLHIGRGPSSRDEQGEAYARDRDDERWPERDRDPRDLDPRDVFMRDLNLPRGRDREIVYDARDRVHTARL